MEYNVPKDRDKNCDTYKADKIHPIYSHITIIIAELIVECNTLRVLSWLYTLH